MTGSRPPAAEYARFLAWAVAVTAAAALLGIVPTSRLGGPGALRAMAAGCLLALVASAVGAVPIALARGEKAGSPLMAPLAAMGLRLLMLVALGFSAVLSGWLEPRPLLIWMVIGHLALLTVDTRYAMRGF